MVATLVRLRLALLRHTLRRDVWRVVLLAAGTLWALSMLPSLLGAMYWLSAQPPEVMHDVLVIGGALIVLGWVIVPTIVPGLDDSLDITRFRMLGVPVGRLVPGLLVAALIGLPTAFTGLVTLAPVIAWGGAEGDGGAVLAAVVMAPLLLATCVVGARLSTTTVVRALGARRAREATVVGGVVATVLVVGTAVGLGSLGLDGALERVPAVADVLAWTPFGAGWAVPAYVADGDLAGAFARAAVAVGAVVLGVAVWTRLLHLTLVRPPARSGTGRRRLDAILPTSGRAAGDAAVALAVLRRARRYWTADPRYLGAVLGGVGLPLLIVVLAATVVEAPAAVVLSMAVLVAGAIGWGRHNDVAFDGSAFWMHVVARVPGWADRAGRAGATLVWALPVVVVLGAVGAVVGGRPELAPASIGAAVGVLGAGLGVSAVSSAALVYPVPAAGTSPYAVQPGTVGASLVAQLVTSLLTAVLCAPVMVAYAAALWWRPGAAWLTLAIGVIGGAGTLAGSVVLGGRVLERRAVRLLTRLR